MTKKNIVLTIAREKKVNNLIELLVPMECQVAKKNKTPSDEPESKGRMNGQKSQIIICI